MKQEIKRGFGLGLITAALVTLMSTLPSQSTYAQVKRPSNSVKKPSTSSVKKPSTSSIKKPSGGTTTRNNNSGIRNQGSSGNRNTNINSNNKNVNINIDNSKDIRINNSRHTTVRHNNYRPYTRPPYRYGGHRYYCHHVYVFHPYRPFYWGPYWHPWGFFVRTLAATAIIISINNQQYHYDQGVYYMAGNGGYTVVQAPVGATVTTLPAEHQTVVVNETTNNYYYGGTYYEKSDKGYTVVPPTAGTIVDSLPEGGEEVTIGEQKYVKFGETYYQPIQVDGKNKYEVVEVQDDK